MVSILKKLVLSFLILLVFLITLVVLIWFKPHLVINEKSLAYLSKGFKLAGHEFSWAHMDIDIQNTDWLKKSIQLEAKSFCAKQLQVSNRSICLKQTKIDFDFKLGRKGVSLIEFDELTLANMEIVYRIEQTEDSKNTDPPPGPQEWLEKLETISSIRNLHMNSKSIRILTSDQELNFDFLLRGHVRPKDMALALELSNLQNHPKWTTKSVVQVELSSKGKGRLPLNLEGRAFLNSRAGENITLEIHGEHNWPEVHPIKLSGNGNIFLTDHKIHFSHGLIYNPESIKANLSGIYDGVSVPFMARVKQCDVNVDLANELKNILLNCPLHITAKESLFKNVQGRKHLIKTLEGNFRMIANNLSFEELGPKGNVRFTFKSTEGKPVMLNATLTSKIPRIPSENFPDLEELQPKLDMNLKLADVNRLFLFLEAYESGPPAPFRSLRGPVSIHIETSYEGGQSGWEIPFTVNTNLTSPNQNFDSGINGNISIIKKGGLNLLRLKIDATIEKATLILPTLERRGLPNLFEDERIKEVEGKKPASEQKQLALDYQIHIKTMNNKPLFIQSNHAIDKIPVHLDIRVENEQPVVGKIQVDNFRINLFRRNARIDYFSLKANGEEYDVDGKLTVAYVDYVVHLLIDGTTDHLRLTFESEPPLPESDIISILFFGYPLQEGSTDQADSVSNVQAAAASGAIGLASLYFFASTPIESIYYDPSLNRYTAKIRISDGTSVIVGSGQVEGGIYGIKRKLGKGLYISTEYQGGSTEKGSSTTTLLEWILRY